MSSWQIAKLGPDLKKKPAPKVSHRVINSCIHSQRILQIIPGKEVGLGKKIINLTSGGEARKGMRIQALDSGAGSPENLSQLFAAARMDSCGLPVDVTASVPMGCTSEPLSAEGLWVCLEHFQGSFCFSFSLVYLRTLSWTQICLQNILESLQELFSHMRSLGRLLRKEGE